MIYEADTYYWDDLGVDRQKAELAVARIVSRWAESYEARLLAPSKGAVETKRSGQLPGDPAQRAAAATEVVAWIHENSLAPNLFYLMLRAPGQGTAAPQLFDHHDTGSTWYLELSKEQAAVLSQELAQDGLPADLFYPSNETISVPYKLFGLIPFGDKMYSPKKWHAIQAAKENGA